MFYTYVLRWTQHGKSYYGARWSKNARPDDLCTTYFSSSETVKQFIEKNGLPDVVQVRRLFSSYEDVIQWEYRVLTKLKANKSEHWLNKCNGSPTPGFYCNDGMVTAKDSMGRIAVVSKEDFCSGEYAGIRKGAVPHNKGLQLDLSTRAKISSAVKSYFSSENGINRRAQISKSTLGIVACINLKTGLTERVSKEAFEASDHLVGVNHGVTQSEEHRRKNSEANTGRIHSEATRSKISSALKGKKKNLVACFDTLEKKCVSLSSAEFHSNKERYIGVKRAKNLGYI